MISAGTVLPTTSWSRECKDGPLDCIPDGVAETVGVSVRGSGPETGDNVVGTYIPRRATRDRLADTDL